MRHGVALEPGLDHGLADRNWTLRHSRIHKDNVVEPADDLGLIDFELVRGQQLDFAERQRLQLLDDEPTGAVVAPAAVAITKNSTSSCQSRRIVCCTAPFESMTSTSIGIWPTAWVEQDRQGS